MSQTTAGKAFEYALARSLVDFLSVAYTEDSAWQTAQHCYERVGEGNMRKAADEAVLFLMSFDKGLEDTKCVSIQADIAGRHGDVRDVIAHTDDREIGFSAKHNHDAVKHQRLSSTIDFGKEWVDYPVSSRYWKQVEPVFSYLQELREQGVIFKDIENKEGRIYEPVLNAFEKEIKRLYKDHGKLFIHRLFAYLVGKYDFYKIVRDTRKKHVVVHPYNMNGTLGYGQKWRLPTAIDQIKRKEGSSNTLLVSFIDGWQISFRIHSAKEAAEPSLKFDVRFVSVPLYTTVFHIPLSD